MQWRLLSSQVPQTLSEFTQILLSNRGITDVSNFLQPVHPADLTPSAVGIDEEQLARALKRLQQAHEQQEDVVILGDYDVDGVAAATVLWQTLHAIGSKVRPFLPIREKHGYGLSNRVLDDLLSEQKPALIVTVDNGIVAHGPAERLREVGVDLIITDHHQPETNESGKVLYPPAEAVVLTTQLCGTTVSWMLARAVLQKWATLSSPAQRLLSNRQYQLDLCALATIADQVPLVGANRSFAKYGLEALQLTKRVGLLALFAQAGVDPTQATTQTIGFTLAPRINAMGRLGHSLDALRLLCTTDPQKAEVLAETLGQTNLNRQELTSKLLEDALLQAQTQVDQHVLIVQSPDFHEGVIGLIAGRLMERFYKPAIAMSVGETMVKASARSVLGVNIVELIRMVREDLLEVGGHPMAAGFGLVAEKLEQVREKLWQLGKQQVDSQLLLPSLAIECEVPHQLIKPDFIQALKSHEPHGQANAEPVVVLKQVEVVDIQTMGKEQQHLKLIVKLGGEKSTQTLEALWWGKARHKEQLQQWKDVDLAGVVSLNSWKGKIRLNFLVKDIVGSDGGILGE